MFPGMAWSLTWSFPRSFPGMAWSLTSGISSQSDTMVPPIYTYCKKSKVTGTDIEIAKLS